MTVWLGSKKQNKELRQEPELFVLVEMTGIEPVSEMHTHKQSFHTIATLSRVKEYSSRVAELTSRAQDCASTT